YQPYGTGCLLDTIVYILGSAQVVVFTVGYHYWICTDICRGALPIGCVVRVCGRGYSRMGGVSRLPRGLSKEISQSEGIGLTLQRTKTRSGQIQYVAFKSKVNLQLLDVDIQM